MNKKKIKESISNHIASKSLPDSKLDSLMALQNTPVDVPPKNNAVQYRWAASFAAVVVIMLTSLYFNLFPDLSMDERIGNEVAKNHIKLKPLEVESSSIDVLRSYFTELDFAPIESSLIKPLDKTLMGGRYCSIQGVTAAQLRLKDNKTGKVQSLYQALYTPDVFASLPRLEEGQAPITIYAGGLEVDVWVEKGLLFALTRDAQ